MHPIRILLVPFVSALASAQEPPPESLRTERFEIRFRADSRAEASVDRVAALVEHDLDRILRELGLKGFDGTIRLCLYDDVAELQRVTGVPAAGYSVPLCSHVPHDNDQTRVHELVHVVAERFREKGPEPRNLFFAEGLANAVLRFVDGVHVDCVAAFHRERGDLPALAELHALPDFYAWLKEHPCVGAYDVAGSWMRFLLDQHGADKVRRYYRGVPVKSAFGKDLATLEREWHAHLAKVQLRAGTRRVLRQRLGRTPAERDPDAAALAAALGPASEWRGAGAKDFGETPVLSTDTTVRGRADAPVFTLDGRPTDGDWCEAWANDALGDAIVRCTAEPVGRCFGVKIMIGAGCQALVLRGQGAFLYRDGQAAWRVAGIGWRDRMEIVLRRRGDVASVWVDGALVLEGQVGDAAGPLGIGCVGGEARFRGVAVRRS